MWVRLPPRLPILFVDYGVNMTPKTRMALPKCQNGIVDKLYASIVIVVARIFGKDVAMVRFHLEAPIYAGLGLMVARLFRKQRAPVRFRQLAPDFGD